MSEENVKLTINGQSVEVPKGTNILNAALSIGITIPHFCYHDDLSVAGCCRMCLVHVEGQRKLVTACSTPVAEEMVVTTNSPEVQEAVCQVLEFTLINHPLDCPICDQAGECKLHDYYHEFGKHESRFDQNKVTNPKAHEIGPMLTLDSDRCILCSRCVRFCAEITRTHEMGILNRGDHAEITAVKEVENLYSANLADICPVGAHTMTDFRFKCRVWFLETTPSLCPGCARGCNVLLDHYHGEIQRLRPRRNDAVNGPWMCDAGRLTYKALTAEDRLQRPLLRQGEELVEVSWEEALAEAIRLLQAGGKEIAGQASAHQSNEDAFALAQLLEHLEAPPPAPPGPSQPGWEDDELLRRADRTPNRRGTAHFCGERKLEALLPESKVALVLQEAPLDDLSALKELKGVILLGSQRNATAKVASVVLPVAMFAETNGTYTNFEGRVQRFRQAVPAPAGVLPAWQVLSSLGARLGQSSWEGVEELFEALAESTAAFQGMTFADLGENGRQEDA